MCVFQFVRVYFNLCVCLQFWATVENTEYKYNLQMPMPYNAHQTAAICIFNNYAVRIIINNKCLTSLNTIKLAVQQTVIFPQNFRLRAGYSCPECCKSLKQGGMSKPIQLDLVKKYTRSGHTRSVAFVGSVTFCWFC